MRLLGTDATTNQRLIMTNTELRELLREVRAALCGRMGVEPEQLNGLLRRADDAWEATKP